MGRPYKIFPPSWQGRQERDVIFSYSWNHTCIGNLELRMKLLNQLSQTRAFPLLFVLFITLAHAWAGVIVVILCIWGVSEGVSVCYFSTTFAIYPTRYQSKLLEVVHKFKLRNCT